MAKTVQEESKEQGRPKRVPINGIRNILTTENTDDRFHYCWVNDYLVDRYIQAGYEFVSDSKITVGDSDLGRGSQVGAKISRPVGNGVTGFLMAIPIEWYNEDFAEGQLRVDETERGIKQSGKSEGMYGSIDISSSLQKD